MSDRDRELIERVKAEPSMDAGDGAFVELWEADKDALLALLDSRKALIARLRDALGAIMAEYRHVMGDETAEIRDANEALISASRTDSIDSGGGVG